VEADLARLRTLLRGHKERLRRIVSIRLAVRLARVLDEEELYNELLLHASTHAPLLDPAGEADLVRWLARLVEREVRRRASATAAAGDTRSLRMDGEAIPAETDARRREELERLIDARVAELEPAELREVLLVRDYCGADWDVVQRHLGIPLEAAQDLYRRAHARLAKRLRPGSGKQP
jgi:DNA-directed RNA polymerase specialized sigma24 family protein